MTNKKINSTAIIIFIASVIGFILLTRMAYDHHLSGFDTTIIRDVQRYNFGLLKPVMGLLSLPGKTIFAGASILAVAGLLWWKKYHREALFILAAGGADALSLIIKHVANRPGPQQLGIAAANTPEATFPSSHVVHYIVFFGLLTYFMLGLQKLPNKLRGLITLVSIGFIVAIPFCRVLLGEHWLSDVVGGILLGIASLTVLIWLYQTGWFLPRLKKQFVSLDD